MEIKSIKTRSLYGYSVELFSLFTGKHYYFYSNFYGLLAVADRDTENPDKFTVFVGNAHTLGGSLNPSRVADIVKRSVRHDENKYIKKTISFDVVDDVRLERDYLKITRLSY